MAGRTSAKVSFGKKKVDKMFLAALIFFSPKL